MKLLTFLMLSIITFSVSAEEEAMVVSVKRLTMESALKIAQESIKTCRKKGIQVGVTVVDRSGNTQVVLRDVLAPDITLAVSFQKAYTAVSFSAATSALTRQAGSPLANVDKLMFSAGGLLIQAGGQILGGVGVSGAPGGEIDEECAQAGIKAIIDDLEMSL
ncbi:MAG: heme-binding protein [Gammaproteobacteria bacterium]|nr:heme-binding protein [Gammaproteobacteria bacterium]